jgi:hypothetical protein
VVRSIQPKTLNYPSFCIENYKKQKKVSSLLVVYDGCVFAELLVCCAGVVIWSEICVNTTAHFANS